MKLSSICFVFIIVCFSISCEEEPLKVEEETTTITLVNHSGCCTCEGAFLPVNFRVEVNDVQEFIEVGASEAENFVEVIKVGDLVKLNLSYTDGTPIGSVEKIFDPENPSISNGGRGYEIRLCNEIQIFNF